MEGINTGVNKNFEFNIKPGNSKAHKKTSVNIQNKKENTVVKPFEDNVLFKKSVINESKNQFSRQSGVAGRVEISNFEVPDFKINGQPISGLSSDQAKEIISEDGEFGAKKTGHRIAASAISIAGDDVEKLKDARDATLQGFQEAEAAMGGKLFQISYDTLDIALKEIDDKISQLGGSLMDVTA